MSRMTALFCVAAFLAGTPGAMAQNDLPGEVIDLPSVNEYRLPPAEQRPPAPAIEGPADSPATQPQAAPPQTSTPRNPPTNTPSSNPAPRPATALPDREPPRTTAPRAAPPQVRRPATQSRSAPDQTPAPAPVPQTSAPVSTGEDTAPETAVSPDVQSIEEAPAAPETAPKSDSLDTSQTAANNDSNTVLYGGAAALAVLLAATGFFLWRRSRKVVPPEEEAWEAPEASSAASDKASGASATRKPAPKIYSPPNPAAPVKPQPEQKPEPASADNGGFITSKIRSNPAPQAVTPEQPATATTRAPQPAPATLNKGDLALALTATGASSTLLNAVLNYEITITNNSAKKIENIILKGAMMQADNQAAQNDAAQASGPVHDITELAAGETVTLKGDIRLPLSAIQPISFKSQALFVPLARFIAQYHDETGSQQTETASFLIGQEHEPPRPKMAPFRLDLGPRIFKPVGQRALNV